MIALNQAAIKLNMNYSTLKKYFYCQCDKCPIKEFKMEEKNEVSTNP